jgi:predicted ribonuclease YlaK
MPANNRATKGQKRVKVGEIEAAIADNYNALNFKFRKREFPLTDKQKKLVSLILNPEIKVVFIDGAAGTSKSYLSVLCGLTMLKDKTAKKMLFMRSVVESSQKGLGFLKGTLEEKMLVWRHVLDSKLEELVEPAHLQSVLASGKIEALPINYIRGASWKDMFICIDEAQNLDFEAFKLVLSRVGEGTKLIISGDSDQSDIRNSGFKSVCDMFDDQDCIDMGITSFAFEESDIVRSEICKFIINKFKSVKK